MKYKIDQSISKIIAPVLLIYDGKEERYDSGKQAAEKAEFDKYYLIDSIDIRDNMIEITLKENDRTNDINWCGEQEVSFF